MKLNPREITLTAMLAATMAILSQIAIPLPFTPVPFTLQTAGLIIALLIGGKKPALMAVAIYILLGLAGAPVFHGGKAGPGIVLGPTGGFLMGFLPALWLAAAIRERLPKKGLKEAYLAVGILTVTVLFFGVLWFSFLTKSNLWVSISLTCLPFIPGDIAKLLLFTPLSLAIQRRLANK